MDFFDNIKNRLFPEKEEIVVHEVMKRPESFLRRYRVWRADPGFMDMIAATRQSILDKQSDPETENSIEILESAYANGLVMYPEDDPGSTKFGFLMEYFKDRLIAGGYRLVHTDRKLYEKKGVIHTIEKYHLKPPVSSVKPIDQHFGNIIIEHFSENNVTLRMKLMSNIYSDRLYTAPRSFNELISWLFNDRSGR